MSASLQATYCICRAALNRHRDGNKRSLKPPFPPILPFPANINPVPRVITIPFILLCAVPPSKQHHCSRITGTCERRKLCAGLGMLLGTGERARHLGFQVKDPAQNVCVFVCSLGQGCLPRPGEHRMGEDLKVPHTSSTQSLYAHVHYGGNAIPHQVQIRATLISVQQG